MPRNDPDTRKLSEQLQDMPRKKVEAKISDAKAEIAALKKAVFMRKLLAFRNDVIYSSVVSVLFGFALWAWYPSEFNFYRMLSFGFVWYLLFEELKLHRMFR